MYRQVAGDCADGTTCPTVYVDAGDVIVQGYEEPPAEALPVGEARVRIPRALLIQAVRRLAPTNEEFFRSFDRSAWRLEALTAYGTAESDPSFAAYLRAGRLPPLEERPPKQAWMAAVRQAIAGGKRLGRVHVLTRPLSPYLEYELATYPENVEAGEDVRLADAGEHLELTELGPDFWLLDDETGHPSVLLMDYDEAGRFLASERSSDPAVVDRCRQARDLATSCSVPLSEFLELAR